MAEFVRLEKREVARRACRWSPASLLGIMAWPFQWVWNLSLLKMLAAILAVNSLHVAMQIRDIGKERQMRVRQSMPQEQSAGSTNSVAGSHRSES
jgi:hypothetical protein